MCTDLDEDEQQDELTGSYTFEQLSPKAQQRARDDYTSGSYPHYDWWDSLYEDFIEIARIMGVTIGTHPVKLNNGSTRQDPSIFFSGFSSQGDGACFSGTFECNPTAVADIAAHAPEDAELKRIAEGLTIIQVRAQLEYGGTVSGAIDAGKGSYSHSGTMDFHEIELKKYRDDDAHEAWLESDEPDKELRTLFRDLADWMYRQLNEAHDWYFTNECVDEALTDGQLFDGDGEAII